MNDDNLTEILERSAADVPVGPPPLSQMHRTASRRRTYAVGLAAAAAVAVVASGVALWFTGDVATRDPAPAASDSPSPQPQGEAPPIGFRWVGMGQAVIAVPDSWGTNATWCGTPKRDTVIVDVGAVPLCFVPFPEDTTSVTIRSRERIDQVGSWVPIEVDGERALRSPDERLGGPTGLKIYGASVYLPERDVVFAAESSVSAQAVNDVLEQITILDTLVAVPGFSQTNYGDGDQSKARERYVRALTEAGLRAEVIVEPTPQASVVGFVLEASPAPGTVVEPGSTVTVTVTG